jgi:hypothetical protein
LLVAVAQPGYAPPATSTTAPIASGSTGGLPEQLDQLEVLLGGFGASG